MKVFLLFVVMTLSLNVGLMGQTTKAAPDSLRELAQRKLNEEKFIEARYFFKRAYEAFAAKEDYRQAIECGLETNLLFVRENLYKEAFELCWSMENLVKVAEEKQNAKLPELELLVSKERFRIYMKIGNSDRAREFLTTMEGISNTMNNDSISEEILYAKAIYYYTFGPTERGTACYKELIGKYRQQGNLEKVTECYQNMVARAEKMNSLPLVINTYQQYIAWIDSVKMLTISDVLNETNQQREEIHKALQENEKKLQSKQYVIIALCVLAAILVAALIGLVVVLLRYILLTKKQKKSIKVVNECSQLKSQFIQNIMAQMDPALNSLSQTAETVSDKKEQLVQMQRQIDALKRFSSDIQEFSSLESSLNEQYELQEQYVNTFCEEIMRKVKPYVNPGVETQVNAFRLQAKINAEQLERVLIHLLRNAADFTKLGRITLEFKRKGARVHQFIVTDTGHGIPEEQRENLFKPFVEIKDLTKGDGMGLPICSLIVAKMNGNIILDTAYTKGSRFIVELRT
ncbi:MAG: HAMP domain-containing histidine kinase [Dysgonamonadaceae bacterium]|jgi:signal transduction histidine kinase|nr:HAMP domain-containing histidine kinase [Dysgonamonadaceae bacterium]